MQGNPFDGDLRQDRLDEGARGTGVSGFGQGPPGRPPAQPRIATGTGNPPTGASRIGGKRPTFAQPEKSAETAPAEKSPHPGILPLEGGAAPSHIWHKAGAGVPLSGASAGRCL